MTVAMHAHDLDPRRCTGIARYALGLSSALAAADAETITMVTAPNCGAPNHSAVRHVITPRSRRATYAWWRTCRQPRIERLVPDASLVHVTAPILPVPTARPLVVTVHDLMPLTNPEWYAARARRLFRWCVPWIQQRAGLVLVPSHHVAEQVLRLLELPAARVVVTGEGVDVGWLGGHKDDDTLRRHGLRRGEYFLHLGAVSARKNVAGLVRALPVDGPVLALAGPVADGQTGVALPDSPALRRLGEVADSDVGPLLRNAAALVHPSRFEGFGLTVLEAMAVGTPVVCSDAGALPEVVGEAALVVPVDDTAAWRDALEQVVDTAVNRELRERGLRRARQWTWQATAERTRLAYDALLA